MKKILQEFVKTVSNVEKSDASCYKVCRLKQRLQKRFPQLIFLTPAMRNKSKIVYARDTEASSMVESVVDLHPESSATESEEDISSTGCASSSEMASDNIGITLQDFYNVALFLRCELKGRKNVKWFNSWPPTASDISYDSVKKRVSPILLILLRGSLAFLMIQDNQAI